jgi:hypothetical protein
MTNDLIELVKTRKSFYQVNYRSMTTVLITVLLLIIFTNFLIIYLYITRPEPDYYATSMDGKLMLLNPLNAPNYTDKPLI